MRAKFSLAVVGDSQQHSMRSLIVPSWDTRFVGTYSCASSSGLGSARFAALSTGRTYVPPARQMLALLVRDRQLRAPETSTGAQQCARVGARVTRPVHRERLDRHPATRTRR